MTVIDGVFYVGRACYKQTRDAFQPSRLTGVRLLSVVTLLVTVVEIGGRSRSWNERVYTKTAQNQNGPDQNGPQIFGMSKTAQPKYKTARSHDLNGPDEKRPTIIVSSVFLAIARSLLRNNCSTLRLKVQKG